jgi:hypothetical protein
MKGRPIGPVHALGLRESEYSYPWPPQTEGKSIFNSFGTTNEKNLKDESDWTMQFY